ncbi:hypothetical protein Tco_0412043 [Tanacetum coccineum]
MTYRGKEKVSEYATEVVQTRRSTVEIDSETEYDSDDDSDYQSDKSFHFVEKHVERYPMYDETTHWRLRKPKVGEKYVSVAQFKECLTYYALANGFSLWLNESKISERIIEQ